MFDVKMSAGQFTEYDGKAYGGINNAIRLCLVSLGVKSLPEPQLTLAAKMALKHRAARP